MRFITTSLSVLICVGACATLWICLIVLLSWYVLMCYTKLRALISAQSYLVVFFVLCSIHLWHLQLLFCCHFTHVTIKYHRVSVHMPTCICLSSVDISSAVSVWICFVAFVSLVRFSCSFSVLLWKTGAQNWCHTPRDSWLSKKTFNWEGRRRPQLCCSCLRGSRSNLSQHDISISLA